MTLDRTRTLDDLAVGLRAISRIDELEKLRADNDALRTLAQNLLNGYDDGPVTSDWIEQAWAEAKRLGVEE